jgi:hypothetical protein
LPFLADFAPIIVTLTPLNRMTAEYNPKRGS